MKSFDENSVISADETIESYDTVARERQERTGSQRAIGYLLISLLVAGVGIAILCSATGFLAQIATRLAEAGW